jgi:hypothetical protein
MNKYPKSNKLLETYLYHNINGLKSYVSQKNIITQIDGALKEIEGLLTKIATSR